MASWYASSSVVLREVQHDAVGGTVREALAFGRHVVYSYKLPHTHFVPWGDAGALTAMIASLYRSHLEGALVRNDEGARFAAESFSEERLTHGLISAIRRELMLS
jgi:hypothetical protein